MRGFINKILLFFLILISFSFGQSDGKSPKKYLVFGSNQSFPVIDWNNMVEVHAHLTDIDQDVYTNGSYTIINEYKHGLLGGIRYLSYGYDYDFESSIIGSGQEILILKFLKLFLTYPLNNRIYLGFEGGYFIEGEARTKIKNDRGYPIGSDRELIHRSHWKKDFLEFDYGLLGQFHYNINEFLLVTIDGYYGLSKFSEENDEAITMIPNVFHYINLGVGFKLVKKAK